jgi:hypothetical protein
MHSFVPAERSEGVVDAKKNAIQIAPDGVDF